MADRAHDLALEFPVDFGIEAHAQAMHDTTQPQLIVGVQLALERVTIVVVCIVIFVLVLCFVEDVERIGVASTRMMGVIDLDSRVEPRLDRLGYITHDY